MTVRARRGLFYLLVLAFFIGGTSVVLYSQGWRIDLHTFALKKVGALYIRTFPRESTLMLDGKEIANKAWLLREGTFVDSLFPKQYELEVTAPGYRTWRQLVPVQTSLVSERKFIVLVPTAPTPVATNTIAITALRDGSIARITKDGIVVQNDITPITGTRILDSSANGRYLLISDGRSTTWYDHGRNTWRRISAANTSATTHTILDPSEGTRYITITTNAVRTIDAASEAARTIATARAGTRFNSTPSALNGSRIAWTGSTSTSSVLYVQRKNAATASTPQTYYVPSPVEQLEWLDEVTLAVRDAAGSLRTYTVTADEGSGVVEVAHGVRDALWSAETVAVRGAGYIELIPYGPERERREGVRINLAEGPTPEQMVWHRDGQHLILIYRDHATLLDLVPNLPNGVQVVQPIAQGSAFVYTTTDNTLYALREGTVYQYPFASN